MKTTTPYCYIIGWRKHDKFYYGVRYANGCDPSDLWVKYFTSSKYVSECRSNWGEPDVIQIRQTFSNVDAALIWETRVLTRMRATTDERFLNKNIAGAILIKHCKSYGMRGKKHSEEAKEKMRNSQLGKKHSSDTKRLLSEMKKGVKLGPRSKEAIDKSAIGHMKPIKLICKGKTYNFDSIKQLKEEFGIQLQYIIRNFGKVWTVKKRFPYTLHPFEVGDVVTIEC